MPLTATETEVITAQVITSSENGALQYLKEQGYEMHRATYYRTLARIEVESGKRLYEIAKYQKERHRARIDKLEVIESLMWKNYHKCDDPAKCVRILKEIREMQVYLSAFDQGTAGVIEEVIKNFGRDSEENYGESISNLFNESKDCSSTTKAS